MGSNSFKLKSSWLIRGFFVSLGTVVLAVSFQNCGKAGFDTENQENLGLVESESINDPTPFAFEAIADQISYLSCSSKSSQGKSFTFKIGAYQAQASTVANAPDMILSGVRVKKEYIAWAKSNIKPTFNPNDPNNMKVTLEQAKTVLATSKKNERAQLQFSMRDGKNLNNVFTKSSTVSYGVDIVPVLGSLTDDRWLAPLMLKSFDAPAETEFVNFFPVASEVEKRSIEASLDFNANEETANAVRKNFDGTARLILGYDNVIDNTTLRSPSTDKASVAYGLGYRTNFQMGIAPLSRAIRSSGPSTPHSLNPRILVTGVEEVNLETGRGTGRTWSCADSRRYVIVREKDRDRSYLEVNAYLTRGATPAHLANLNALYPNVDVCPKMVIADLTPDQLKELSIVRRHFPVKDWDVNVVRKCLVPKTFSCYQDQNLPAFPTGNGTPDGLVPIEYDLSAPCFYNTEENVRLYGNNPPLPYCAEVASICVRN